MCTYRFRSPPTQAPPPPPLPPPPPGFINYSGVVVWAGCSRGTREQSEGTVGVLQLHLPGSLGLTGGCVPFQDPVYSQPQRLPGTHFHNAAWSPVRKRIPLCRRCSATLSAPLRSAPRPLCILRLPFLSFVSICFPASHLHILPRVAHLLLLFTTKVLFLPKHCQSASRRVRRRRRCPHWSVCRRGFRELNIIVGL